MNGCQRDEPKLNEILLMGNGLAWGQEGFERQGEEEVGLFKVKGEMEANGLAITRDFRLPLITLIIPPQIDSMEGDSLVFLSTFAQSCHPDLVV